jgi:AcrR family transcriptional regulator
MSEGVNGGHHGDMTLDSPGAPRVRLPVQRRSKASWTRVLEAGVALLAEEGYASFTIAAICERAAVAPRFIYDRVDDKDSLFLAVYEHGIAAVRIEQDVFDDDVRWAGLTTPEVILAAVDEVGLRFRRHDRFLRTIVLISSENAEVRRRGAFYKAAFESQFTRRVVAALARSESTDPTSAVGLAFDLVFAAWVVRVAYGPGFSGDAVDDAEFSTGLGHFVIGALLHP